MSGDLLMNVHNQRFTDRTKLFKQRMDLNEMEDRVYRLLNIDLALKEHLLGFKERPSPADISVITDMILNEELTDPDPYKVAHNEYPILSETQLARRREGKHTRKTANPLIEVPLSIAENYGTDGRAYDYPARRKRSERENMFVDKEAKTRNKERQHTYQEFTKVQPVIVRKIGL
jgi:hypothetical protein